MPRIAAILGISLITMFSAIPPVYAGYDYRYDAKYDLEGQYESGTSAKLSRGFNNILFGWTEIARTPAKTAAGIDGNKYEAVLLGIPHGILRFGARTVVGVYEVVTCYAPQSPIMKNLEGDVV